MNAGCQPERLDRIDHGRLALLANPDRPVFVGPRIERSCAVGPGPSMQQQHVRREAQRIVRADQQFDASNALTVVPYGVQDNITKARFAFKMNAAAIEKIVDILAHA
ncbi:MAG: hypothetical protein KGN16_14500 [Burkholderiales bacterium]|nr:hypothetical protein [Burkholderiales bacterium]